MASPNDKASSWPGLHRTQQTRTSAPGRLQIPPNDIQADGRPELVKLWSVSKNGVNSGELRGPKDVSFCGVDKVAVSEVVNGRVQMFDSLRGSSEGLLDRDTHPGLLSPSGINLSQDKEILFTADLNQVHLLDPLGRSCLGCCVFPGALYGIRGVCGDLYDNMIITNLGSSSSAAIYHLDHLKKPVRKLKTEFGEPGYVIMDYNNGLIYVSDSSKHCVHVFDKKGHKLIRQIGKEASSHSSAKLLWPMGMCVTPEGHLLVVDRASDRVCVYDKNGTFLYHLFHEQDGIKGPVSIATNNHGLFAIVEETLDYGKDHFSMSMYREAEHMS